MTRKSNSLPPYQKLQIDLAKVIANARPGERLPSEPKLAHDLGVSRSTLREVMRIFEGQGVIRRRQGVGTFVVSNEQGDRNRAGSAGKHREHGKPHQSGSLDGREQVKADAATAEQAKLLGAAENATVVKVTQVILAESKPVPY